MIEKHQYILEELLESHPNNTGFKMHIIKVWNLKISLSKRLKEKLNVSRQTKENIF